MKPPGDIEFVFNPKVLILRISPKHFMIKYILALLLPGIFFSCTIHDKILIPDSFANNQDSNYKSSKLPATIDSDLVFWKQKMLSSSTDFVSTLRYASVLISRFNLSGDIRDVKTADSLLLKMAELFNEKEASPYMALSRHAILQHEFHKADSFLQKALLIGIKAYDSLSSSFDVQYELGNMEFAGQLLSRMKDPGDYGYQFRTSKWMHYKADLDSSIAAMQIAVLLAGSNRQAQLAALSNAGDLYLHADKPEKAFDCYARCLDMEPADLHSLMGIGWLALVHDKNLEMAGKIFRFVHSRTLSPEPLFKLTGVAQQSGDSVLEKIYAQEFERMVTVPVYGRMYNKYLVQLYTGILNKPARAEQISLEELNNRSTPQTYAWYAFALLSNNKPLEALSIYVKYVSGKPLEALELYFMGKLMQSMKKGFNAKQYFEEAAKNKYDLMPAVLKDLERCLKE